ncbi:DGAT1/2-independent enzyme synthesizing storage lipids-like isoform X1 [Lepidochelys kempii]|uniref:DGAT1/2-independent enzyme synthesizing storage lipids isoform X1 n=2 Tax=Caretta caretta TaxID=8467 RepID=UPI00209568CA|nr:transmembrane protein 68 isoform X1 [Caretta caretta]XP_048696640.1 transmembrane protein 68 isoform X1 [Caretta caretta]
MIHRNESCTSGQVPMSYLCCLIYILEEWTGVEYLEDYLNYVAYLLWVFTPLIIVFILPGLILLLLYISIIFLYVYKRKNELKEAYSNDIWDGARQMVATLWDGHARIWHGYEVHGLEKIPEGPGLVVFYHGATPIDYFYFLAKLLILKNRMCYTVADHFVFKLPGFKLLLDVFGVMHGPKEECVKALKNGRLVAISPGGVREALFSDETYVLVWGNRTGFAQVAIDAKVPIIPLFTQNVREGIRTLGGIRLFRLIYERLRLPLVPLYGDFPVKFRTYIGDPIPYDPNINAAELSGKAKAAIQSLIDRHQKIPGNVFRALMERFETQQKED